MKKKQKFFDIKCNMCEILFTVSRYFKDKRKFCSRKCSTKKTCFKKGHIPVTNIPRKVGENNNKWKGGQILKYCRVCSNTFYVDLYRVKTAKCCSPKCSGVLKRGKRMSKKTEFKPKFGVKDLKGIKLKIRQNSKYHKWRTSVYERDHFTCLICKKHGGKLNADHYPKSFSEILRRIIQECNKKYIFRNALKDKELFDLNNGRTLCEKCHIKTDTFGSKNISR